MSTSVSRPVIRSSIRIATLVSLILIAGSAAIPRFCLRGRGGANEAAAIATLKILVSAQQQFRELSVRDVDGDGRGEYGAFADLSRPCTSDGHPLLSRRFRIVEQDGTVTRSGYRFRIVRPRAGGGWVHEGQPWRVDVDGSEDAFVAVAWPVSYSDRPTRHRRVFVVDPQGEVFACDNRATRYHGPFAPPVFTCLPSGRIPAANTVGPDGNRWRLVR